MDARTVRTVSLALLLTGLASACGGSGGGGDNGGGVTVSPDLSALTVTTGTLTPGFAPDVTTYSVGPGLLDASVSLRPTAVSANATIRVNTVVVLSGAPSPSIPLAVGTTPVTLDVTVPGGAQKSYTVVFRRAGPNAQEAYGKASNPGSSDFFGGGVALEGDTLVVGAASESSHATGIDGDQSSNAAYQAGAAYVFVRVGGTWSQQAYLKASNTGAGDTFGNAVAISGNTIAIGAPHESSNAVGVDGNQANDAAMWSGAVYVFVRDGTSWSQQAYLKASNTGAQDVFGTSVALYGDALVVGAPGEDSSATGTDGVQANEGADGSGAAYVFLRTGATWAQQSYLKATNTGAGDSFGIPVAIYGNTLAVGAVHESSNATGIDGFQANNLAPSSGAVYVFERSLGTWTQQAYVKASNAGAGDWFGRVVSLGADVLAVSATLEDSASAVVPADDSAPSSGAVYVFARNGTTWSQQAFLKASNADAGDNFGSGMAMWGDTLVVGAAGERGNATGLDGNQADDSLIAAGAAYVFLHAGATWVQQTYVKAHNTDAGDNFGGSLAISGDTFVVTATSEASSAPGINGNGFDNGLLQAGAVYVFR